ncbi:MAG: hypothetical protein ACPG4U_11155 [Pseudomonadales bacterium]
MPITDKPHIERADAKPKKLSDKHLALARRGAELTRLIKDHKTELDTINEQLKKDIGHGVTLVLPEEHRIPIAQSVSHAIDDAAGLKSHLGARKYNLYVKTTVSTKPAPVLLELAESSADVAAFLKQKTSVSVKYLPIKTQQ